MKIKGKDFLFLKLSDFVLLEKIQENRPSGAETEEECKKYHIPFFDTSHNREEVLKEAEKFIQEKEEQNESYTKRVKEEII